MSIRLEENNLPVKISSGSRQQAILGYIHHDITYKRKEMATVKLCNNNKRFTQHGL
jgi:hypothetical protein